MDSQSISWNGKESHFCYIRSCDVSQNIKLKINNIDNQRKPLPYREVLAEPVLTFSPWADKTKCADLIIKCQVFDGSFPLSLPTQTYYKEMTTRWDYYQWIELPVQISNLPRESKLVFTIWDSKTPGTMFCIGSCSTTIFDEMGEMKHGKCDIRVIEDPSQEDTPEVKKLLHKLQDLENKVSKYEGGEITKIDWMDRLAFKEITQLTDRYKKESGSLFLNIEFPTFTHISGRVSILHHEQGGNTKHIYPRNPKYCKLYDPSAGLENIVEKKHLAVARSVRSGLGDKDIRPNAEIKKKLTEIMEYPPTTILSGAELDLVWKHRYYLSDNEAGLTKFLKCVDFDNLVQTDVAREMLNSWAVLNAENALELLGPSFTCADVRKYAVNRLGKSSDEDLMLYLLQLVQALKFDSSQEENIIFDDTHYSDVLQTSDVFKSLSIGEKESPLESVSQYSEEDGNEIQTTTKSQSSDSYSNLLDLLIERSSKNMALATSFYWFLKVECEVALTNQQSGGNSSVYFKAIETLRNTLKLGEKKAQVIARDLGRQDQLVSTLLAIAKKMESSNLSREGKERFLKQELSCPDLKLLHMEEPLPLPLDPNVHATGMDLDGVQVFKSSLEPCKFTFKTRNMKTGEAGPPYNLIFKVGDDLRQDQLILQLITLMQRLLLRENLDLKLTPYRVLATGGTHGFVQFIDAAVLAGILRDSGSILQYLQIKNPDPAAPQGVSPHVLDNYIRSCAGYSIITYILGVGDRHHDNLMLASDGCFFHIDFGFILGRDPKPMPPLIKLSREMTDGFGGQNSDQYQLFKQLCRTTFLCLRRHANLVLNLFSLMVDASITDIALEPERAVRKVEEKLHLDLTDEEASSKLMSVLNESAGAVMAAVAENFHKITQYIRN